MFQKISQFLTDLVLPAVVFCILSLYAADIIYELYTRGKLSDGNEKELMTFVSAIVAHLITKKN